MPKEKKVKKYPEIPDFVKRFLSDEGKEFVKSEEYQKKMQIEGFRINFQRSVKAKLRDYVKKYVSKELSAAQREEFISILDIHPQFFDYIIEKLRWEHIAAADVWNGKNLTMLNYVGMKREKFIRILNREKERELDLDSYVVVAGDAKYLEKDESFYDKLISRYMNEADFRNTEEFYVWIQNETVRTEFVKKIKVIFDDLISKILSDVLTEEEEKLAQNLYKSNQYFYDKLRVELSFEKNLKTKAENVVDKLLNRIDSVEATVKLIEHKIKLQT